MDLYIDWKELNLSYYYHDFSDGANVHANNEDNTKSQLPHGIGLLARCRYPFYKYKDVSICDSFLQKGEKYDIKLRS